MSTRTVTPTIGAPVAVLAPMQRPILQRTCDCGRHTGGGECEDCKKKKMSPQRQASSPPVAPPIVHEVLISPGQPLDPETRSFMEPRFGHDFSKVRVHTDGRAAESARSVSAQAYTVGRHVVFGAGHYSPQTSTGRSLLSHELTHVVQQSSAGAVVPGELRIGEAENAAEREAAKAEKLPAAQSMAPISVTSPRVQGKWDWERAGWGTLIGGGIGGAGLAISAAAGAPGFGIGLLAGGLIGGFLIGGLTGKEEKGGEQAEIPSLEDPNFRKKWEAGLQKGLAHLKEVQPQGCEFPAGAQHRYDIDYWTEVATPEDLKVNAHRYKPKTSVPYQAVELLSKRLDHWTCDCRMFGEIAQLFAWFEALRDRPDLFNKKFEGLLLASESTNGLERTKIESGEASDVDDAKWRSAPVGSKVVWSNWSPYAKTPWGYEHAIKSAVEKPGTPALYAAQGIGFDKREDEVKLEVARHCVPDFPFTWTVTDETINKFKSQGLSSDKITKLESVKGKRVKYFTEFVKQPALVEINGGRIHVPFRDEGGSSTTNFFFELFHFAERQDPQPGDKDVEKYVRENIHREKVEIPK